MDTFGGHGGGGGGRGGGGGHASNALRGGGGHPLGEGRGGRSRRNWQGGGYWGPSGYLLVDGYYDDLLDDVIDNYDEEEDSLGGMIWADPDNWEELRRWL